jgi:hypothetical protein
MARTVLLLVVLAAPLPAAPRLKDRKPAPDPEEARIAALKAQYDEIRKSGNPTEQVRLAVAEAKVRIILHYIDGLGEGPASPRVQEQEAAIEREAGAHPAIKDLYDIAKFDRKKAAAGK